MHQLHIAAVFSIVENWDPIIDLESKAVRRVVQKYHVLEVSVGDNPKVLEEDVLVDSNAVVPAE